MPSARRERTASAKVELAAHERERAADAARMRERAEIHPAVLLAQPREREARDRVVEIDLQQQEPLVVAEVDVEARLKILDEFSLQQQRLRLVFHHVPVEIVDGIHQRVELEIPAQAP